MTPYYFKQVHEIFIILNLFNNVKKKQTIFFFYRKNRPRSFKTENNQTNSEFHCYAADEAKRRSIDY